MINHPQCCSFFLLSICRAHHPFGIVGIVIEEASLLAAATTTDGEGLTGYSHVVVKCQGALSDELCLNLLIVP